MTAGPGSTLSHYQLVEKIGEGGMGVVWRAHDTTLERDVALKVLPDSLAGDADRLARFEREARTLAALNHPNIVTIHSVEEGAGVRFFTMELVEGGSLAALIPKRGLPLDQFFPVAIQLADALSAAHERGVTHRDLKPANVMVGSDGRVKVLDFGLAKPQPRAATEDDPLTRTETLPLTKEGTVLGTAPYMSPEQLQGSPLDGRSDIFSLGVMLYETLTGTRPFGGRTPADLTSSILRDTPRSVDEVRVELPHHLGRIIRRCLEKDPERRFQSAKEVRNEIAALKDELASEPSGSQAGPVVSPSSRRRRWLVLGVALPLLVLAVVIALRLFPMRSDRQSTVALPRFESLAVLPFDNLMNDPEQDYFVNGMHEALITDLARIGQLRVISRTSVARYKDSGLSLPEIAAELGVDALVEGSVLRAGNQIRITAQLIDGETDEHLWADEYDRELENILSLLSEVARAIASEIEITLTPRQVGLLATDTPVNPEAYEVMLRGEHAFNRITPEGYLEALPLFQRAVEIDPNLAQAWSRLSGTYLVLAFFGIEPAEEMVPLSRAAARRALEIDDRHGGAHGALGSLALYFDWDWETAARELELAIELDPTNSMIRHGYADYLGVMGDMDASVRQVELGRQYDPMGLMANGVLLGHLFFAGRYEDVLTEGAKAESFLPDHPTIGNFQASALWQLGRYEEAIEKYRQAYGAESGFVRSLESGYVQGGPEVAMRRCGERLVKLSESRPVSPHNVARYFAQAGDLDTAFEWLEKALAKREPLVLHTATMDPRLASLHADPRYDELLRRFGFPERE